MYIYMLSSLVSRYRAVTTGESLYMYIYSTYIDR